MKAGSYIQLVQAVKEGRVLRKVTGGLPMFFFPRREYSKECSYTQDITGDMKLEGGSMEDFDHAVENQLGFIWDPTGASGGMEIDDEQKLLPLPGCTTGMGDLAVGDGGSTSMMAPSSMGLGGPHPAMGFGMAMGLGNGSSTPTSSLGPTSSGMGVGFGAPSPMTKEAKKELSQCLQDLGKALALAVKVLQASEVA